MKFIHVFSLKVNLPSVFHSFDYVYCQCLECGNIWLYKKMLSFLIYIIIPQLSTDTSMVIIKLKSSRKYIYVSDSYVEKENILLYGYEINNNPID